jgi:hypothetical protein
MGRQSHLAKVRVLEDIDCYKVWEAGTVESDWPVHLFIKCEYTDHYDREWAEAGLYHFSIEAVAPQAPPAKEVAAALRSMGMTRGEYAKIDDTWKCRTLADYGLKAVLWQRQGGNMRKLLWEARREALLIQSLFGFYMDKQMNAIGNDGWDFIRGQIGFKREEVEAE